MKGMKEQFYEEPSIQMLELANEGVLCNSGETEQFETGDIYGEDDFI